MVGPVRVWRASALATFYLPLLALSFAYAALKIPGVADKIVFGGVAAAVAVFAGAYLQTKLSISETEISLQSPIKSWRTPLSEIVLIDKVRGNDRITGLRLLTEDGRRLRFGLTDFRNCQSLADTLLQRIPADRIAPDALRILVATRSG